MTVTLLDTGPLVAYSNDQDAFHAWAEAQMKHLIPPLVTCEAVLTEACFLLQRTGRSPAAVVTKVRDGVMELAFDLETEAAAVESLMRRYEDAPMSLADACLVRLSELNTSCRVFTLDSRFKHYRRHGRSVIPLLAPW